jgi:hypothetical protein
MCENWEEKQKDYTQILILGRTSITWIEKSGSPTTDEIHISSVYIVGVSLQGVCNYEVRNYENEVNTRRIKMYWYIFF